MNEHALSPSLTRSPGDLAHHRHMVPSSVLIVTRISIPSQAAERQLAAEAADLALRMSSSPSEHTETQANPKRKRKGQLGREARAISEEKGAGTGSARCGSAARRYSS